MIRSLANGFENFLRSSFALHILQEIVVNLEADAVFLQILYQLRVGRLVADGIVNIVSAQGPSGFPSARGRLGVTDQVRQRLIFNFDQANGIFSGGLIDGCDGYDFISGPRSGAAGFLNNFDSFHAG